MLPHYFSLLLFLSCHWPEARAQNLVADCGPNLLPLAPCGSFVQGRTPKPVEACCDNVAMLYKRNLTCLCVLLENSGSISPFPINVSLALQLPLLCKLKDIDPSICPGASMPSFSPPKSSAAASPMITMTPRPRFTGFRLHPSSKAKLEVEIQLMILLLFLPATILFHT